MPAFGQRVLPRPQAAPPSAAVVATPQLQSHAGRPVPDAEREPAPMSSETAIYTGDVMVLDWATSASSGRTAKFTLTDTALATHPFRGLRVGRGQNRGHRLRVSLLQLLDTGDDAGLQTPLFAGECSLVWWGDDCTNGMRVTLRFEGGPEGEDWHPLTGIEADRKHGEVIYLAVWAVADDEGVEDPRDARRASKPFVTLAPAQQSQIKCRLDHDFQRWCCESAASLLGPEAAAELVQADPSPVKFAEQMVRRYLGVESRSALSQDTAEGLLARNRWRELMRLYESWRYGGRI